MEKHREIIQKLFENDEYARSLGIMLDELTETTIKMHMRLRTGMLNFYGRPHGAAMKSVSYRTGRPIDPDVDQ